MNKEVLITLIQLIKNDLDHYKTKSNFIKLLEKLTKEEKIIEKKIEEYLSSLKDEIDYSKEIELIEVFINKFQKKYIQKIERSDGVIYEFPTFYKFYPNKKSKHVANYYKDKFLKEDFDEIVIDNVRRKETLFSEEILQDIKYADTCFIIINKK